MLYAGAPTRTRNVSSIALRLPKQTLMVDCGEATCRQAVVAGIKPQSIKNIFITHLHGDHCFGLVGMLNFIGGARRGTHLAKVTYIREMEPWSMLCTLGASLPILLSTFAYVLLSHR